MPEQEKLRCNICDTTVGAGEAKEHAAGQLHAEKKSKLEGELAAAKVRMYSDDGSVAARWAGAISQ